MGQLKACWLPLVMAVFFRLSAEWLHREDAGAAAAPPFENPACSQASVTVVCVYPSWLGARSTASMLCCGVTAIRCPARCLPLQKIAAACGYRCTQSPVSHPWCYIRHGDAMLLPPVLTCPGVPQNQGGIADSIYGNWAAGLLWIAGRSVANTRSAFSGLWLSESVALLTVCKPQSGERQVNEMLSRWQWWF